MRASNTQIFRKTHFRFLYHTGCYSHHYCSKQAPPAGRNEPFQEHTAAVFVPDL